MSESLVEPVITGVHLLFFILFSTVFVPEEWNELTLLIALEKKCSGKSWPPVEVGLW